MTAAQVSKAPSRARRASATHVDATVGEVTMGLDAKVRTRPEDRWQTVVAPVGRFSGAMGLVLLVSLALHALIVGSALIPSPADAVVPERETPVEIVQEMPKEEPKETLKQAPKQDTSKPPAADPPSELRKATSEQPDVKPPPPEQQAARTQPEPPQAQPEPAKAEPEPSKAEAPKADGAEEKLAALKTELEELKAQRQALEAERAASEAAAPPLAQAGSMAAGGLGPLPDSFRAVALPTSADGADEAVSYGQIVFSQLAKAKGIGGREGRPGSAGVRFAINDAGHLVSVAVVAPSGDPSLDAEALAIVRRAAPFPPPPAGAQRVFAANVNFTPAAALPPAR